MLASQEGMRAVTIEIVVGALVTAILVLLFLDIAVVVKILLVAFLGIVGVLNFLGLTGQTNKWRSKIAQRRREGAISRHPDLITELYRLNEQIRKVAYDRNASYPSLALNGDNIIVALVNADESHDQTLLIEFKEKLVMAQSEYQQFQARVQPYSQGLRRWESTSEFASILRDLSSNMAMINYTVRTVYRQTSLWKNGKPFPEELKVQWESFKDEFNAVLHDWKAFTDKFDRTIGYGTGTQVENVKSIPQSNA